MCVASFANFTIADKLFAESVRIFETCLSVDNNLSEKLVSSLKFPIQFDKRFKVTSVTFSMADFNLLSFELDSFTFSVLY